MEYLGDNAFAKCINIIRVDNVPQALNNGFCSESGPFAGCNNIAEVTFEEGIRKIPNCIFMNLNSGKKDGDTGLQQVTIPESVITIGHKAFQNTSLKSLALPLSVKYVEYQEFCECDQFTDLFVENQEAVFAPYILDYPYNMNIHGYESSTAQAYAKQIGALFVPIGIQALVLNVSDINNAHLAEALEIKTSVTGGVFPYEYRYVIQENGINPISTSYSSKNNIIWTPSYAGPAQIVVHVRDSQGVEESETINVVVEGNASVVYQALVEDNGWQDVMRDGETAGTIAQSKKLEAIKIEMKGTSYSVEIEYQTHIQKYGWEPEWKQNGDISGSLDGLRLEAMRIRLTGELAEHYDIYYRLHVQKLGWLDWAKNGKDAGTSGYGYRVEGIQIKLVRKGNPAPGPTKEPFHNAWAEKYTQINYQTQVQKYGWLETVSNGEMSGTQQEGLRVEGIKIWLSPKGYSGSVEYKSLVQNKGWEKEWKKDGEISGTSGESLRIEAIQIRLTDELAAKYDIYYRVQAQKYGWLGWACNGAKAGSEGHAKRLEAIEIQLVKKSGPAPGSTENPFIE